MIPVFWHLNDSNWDTAYPKYLLSRAGNLRHMPKPGLEFALLYQGEKVGVIVIPGRHSAGAEHYEQIRQAGKMFDRVVYMIMGDEEGIFHADEIELPGSITWWFMPPLLPMQNVDRVTITGWPTSAPDMLLEAMVASPDKLLDWCFLGQMTHSRRIECVNAVQGIPHGHLVVSPGFTQGVPRDKYYAAMAMAKFALCPSGPCTPDSFRFAEALVAGCIPIADNRTQNPNYPEGYWNYVLGPDLPFPVINDWDTLPDVLAEWLPEWPERSKRCRQWWAKYLDAKVAQLREDLHP